MRERGIKRVDLVEREAIEMDIQLKAGMKMFDMGSNDRTPTLSNQDILSIA